MLDEEGNRTPARPMPHYFPVLYYGTRGEVSKSLRGYTYGVDPIRRVALEEAYRTRLTTASAPVSYIPDLGGENSTRILRPVFFP